jgi:hypothetical protein
MHFYHETGNIIKLILNNTMSKLKGGFNAGS